MRCWGGLLAACMVAGCATVSEPPAQRPPSSPEAYSLFGTPLIAAPLSADTRDTLESRLGRAQAEYDRNPADADAAIWLGRRTAYLGRFRDAIGIYSASLGQHPKDARLYRHRGHRYLTLRRFESAIADLDQAARLIEGQPDQIEPDGIPNARNTPTSTLQSNVWYHLALGQYLTGDFEKARRSYERCREVSNNPDQLCATTYWQWQTLVRLGRMEEAERLLQPIRDDFDLIENHDYFNLLQLYRGRVTADTLLTSAMRRGGTAFATVGYGVAGWHLASGRRTEAIAAMRQVMAGDAWAAFGYIAAEAELDRLGVRP